MILELITAGISLNQIKDAHDNYKNVKDITQESLYELAKIRGLLENEIIKTDDALNRLANRRNSIFSMIFPYFLNVVKPLDLLVLEDKERQIMLVIESVLGDYVKIKTDFSISKLEMSGKQAITSYLLFGLPGYIKKKSEIALSNSKILKKNVELYNTQVKSITNFLIYFYNKINIMENLLVRINILFIRNLKEVEKIVNQKGANKYLYSREDRELLRVCFNMADAIKKLCEVPIMENDKISKEFLNAIEFGEQQLKEINKTAIIYNSNL